MEAIQSTEYLLNIAYGLTKTQIKVMADTAVQSVLETGNVAQVAEALKAMDELCKAIRADERFGNYLSDELAKHGGKLTTPSGARLEACEAGISYDYSANPAWVTLDQTIASLDVRRKQLEERLRKIPAGHDLTDKETGELLIGPAKSSKSTYKVTLAK